MQIIVQKLKRDQLSKGLTDYELSQRTPLSSSTVGNMFRRNGFPRLDTFLYICEAMGEAPCKYLCDFDCRNLKSRELRMVQLFNRLDTDFQDMVLKTLEDLVATANGKGIILNSANW